MVRITNKLPEKLATVDTRAFYTIPRWCGMHMSDHFDGMGGCWGISSGLVAQQGRDYCRGCSLYRRNKEHGINELAHSQWADERKTFSEWARDVER